MRPLTLSRVAPEAPARQPAKDCGQPRRSAQEASRRRDRRN
jgi:hypothetical protein